MGGKRRRGGAWQSREGCVLCEKQEMGMRGSSEEESVCLGSQTNMMTTVQNVSHS